MSSAFLRLWRELEEKFSDLLNDSMASIPDDLRDDVTSFVDHNEFGIALEELVAGLNKSQLTIDPVWFEKLKAIGRMMKFEDDLWDCLNPQIAQTGAGAKS